jgi:spermidine synthase
MKPWTLLDTTQIPGTAGTLRLLQRGDEFSINLDQGVLMSSRVRGSEEALARLGCARIGGRERPRILIGGLGMGFTLRAALALVGANAEIVVVELVPAVVRWGRGVLAELSGNSLADARVTIREGDVRRVIRAEPSAYDAILLDVDNGPEGLTREANDGLYNLDGLRAGWSALRPGGVLAVWSVAPDDVFSQRLRKIGFAVEEVAVRANGKRGARHLIWVAMRPERSA